MPSLVGSEMCIRDSRKIFTGIGEPDYESDSG